MIDRVSGLEVLRTRWSGLARRERALLGCAAVVLLLALVDMVLVSPALRGIARLERELPERRVQLATIDELSNQFLALSAKAAAPSGSALEKELERELERAAKSLGGAERVAGGDALAQELRFKSVQVAPFFAWLSSTQRDLRVRVTSLEMERTPTPEMVSVRVRFERPPERPPTEAR